jgi:hypothetical protein
MEKGAVNTNRPCLKKNSTQFVGIVLNSQIVYKLLTQRE